MKLGRKKQSIANIFISLVSQFFTVLVGMLLPRALMVNYGSETNGLITSLQQVINYLTLIEGGLLSAVTVSLYKPLADNDVDRVNEVLTSAKYFFRKTGTVFLAALCIVAALYPVIIAQTVFSYFEIVYMVMLIGINGATQIFFIGKYKALLIASQKNGVVLSINAISTVLYSGLLIIAAFLKINVLFGLTIAISAYLIRALMFYLAVKRLFPQYSFDGIRGVVVFPQRGDAFASQILSLISLNGGTLILSIFKAPMAEISVYTTYNLVLSGLFMLMYTVENSMTSAFGDLLVRDSEEKIQSVYGQFDTIYHILWTVVVTCLSVLLLPFIRIYTNGVTDIEYILPLESVLFTLIAATWMLRNQQTLLMTAQGRFRDMRRSMMVEACFVFAGGALGYVTFGLKGLLIAKLAGTLFMCIRLTVYNYKDILHSSLIPKVKNILLSVVSILIVSFALHHFPLNSATVFFEWLLSACCTFAVSLITTLILWGVFRRKDVAPIITKLLRK